MQLKQSVQDQFGAAAARYATAEVMAAGPDLGPMLAALPLTGSERVLDVGCGAGHTALAFAPHVRSVDALDLTPAMLEQVEALAAVRGISSIKCKCGDAEALPYADGDFDVVTARLCTHHFPNPSAGLDEIARVLRPNGHLLVSDVVAPEAPALDTFLNTIELLRDPSHVRDHSVSQWQTMLEAAGLHATLGGRWPVPQSFDAWVERMGTPPDTVRQLRALFRDAHADARREFEVVGDAPESWTLQIALFVARKPPEAAP